MIEERDLVLEMYYWASFLRKLSVGQELSRGEPGPRHPYRWEGFVALLATSCVNLAISWSYELSCL